jgi:hypothetical protein
VLFGVIIVLVAFWSPVVLTAGVLRGWPVIALGRVAGGVAATVAASASISCALDREGCRSSGAGRLA